MAMLLLAYVVVVLTVLSVSAIATSGSVQAGGVYCILTLCVCVRACVLGCVGCVQYMSTVI